MPVYMNGKKYIGAYMNGHRVNGYLHGIKLFSYTTVVHVQFSDGNTQSLYDVPIGSISLDQLVEDYNLNAPDNDNITDDSDTKYDITPNDTIDVNVESNQPSPSPSPNPQPSTVTVDIQVRSGFTNAIEGAGYATLAPGEYSAQELTSAAGITNAHIRGGEFTVTPSTSEITILSL